MTNLWTNMWTLSFMDSMVQSRISCVHAVGIHNLQAYMRNIRNRLCDTSCLGSEKPNLQPSTIGLHRAMYSMFFTHNQTVNIPYSTSVTFSLWLVPQNHVSQ